MRTRREALAGLGALGLVACSGAQHGGTPVAPAWLSTLETIIGTAGAIEPVACGALIVALPTAAPACALVGSTLTLLTDAIDAYRAAQGQPNALCVLRSAVESALAARLDVIRLLAGANVPAAGAINAIAGMISLALDAVVPPCTTQPALAAIARLRAVYTAPRQ